MIKSANGAALEAIGNFIKRNPYLLAGGGIGTLLGALGGYNMVDETGDEEEDSSNRMAGGVAGGLAGLLAGVTAGYFADGAGAPAAPTAGGNAVPPKQDATDGNGGDASADEGSNRTPGQTFLGMGIGTGVGAGASVLRNRQLEASLKLAQTEARNAARAVTQFRNMFVQPLTDAEMRTTTYNGKNGGDLMDTNKMLHDRVDTIKAKTTPRARAARIGAGGTTGSLIGGVSAPYLEQAGASGYNFLKNLFSTSN